MQATGLVRAIVFATASGLFSSSLAAQEYVARKSFDATPERTYIAAQHVFWSMYGKVIEKNDARHTMRVRFDQGRGGGFGFPGVTADANYAVFSVAVDPNDANKSQVELRIGRAPMSSLPSPTQVDTHSPIPGAKFVDVRSQSTAKTFFRKLKKQLQP